MKKSALIVWGITLGLSLGAVMLPVQPAKATEAAAPKQTLELGNAVYYYKDSTMSVQMYGSNDNLVQAWKKGNFLTIDYAKGKVVKKYSIIPEDSAAAQKQNEAALGYLQSILPQMKPYLQTFQRLSEQVPLK
ncbi:hypothetical protein [Paenibacillus medicaginis]|uniref:Uncharacterized protein n=1 Tax=Paenibacillus medicaginis TaxID=1470560 RepID=A0ABV5C2X0_9BACL